MFFFTLFAFLSFKSFHLSKTKIKGRLAPTLNFVYGLQKRYFRHYWIWIRTLTQITAKAVYIINSAGIAYHQNEVLYIIIAKRNAACGWWYTPSVMRCTLARDDIPLLSQWIKNRQVETCRFLVQVTGHILLRNLYCSSTAPLRSQYPTSHQKAKKQPHRVVFLYAFCLLKLQVLPLI